MKAKIQRLLCVSLACLLLVVATGCSGTVNNEPDQSAQNSEQNVVGSPSSEATDNAIVEMDCFINHSWFFTDRYEGIIPEVITEKTGVKLNVTRAVDDRQLGLMIASGDLPELIFTQSELERLSTGETSYSYNELIEQYCPDWKVDAYRETNAKAYSSDDNYYFLLNCFSTEEEWNKYPGTPQVPSLAYRADILQELGNPPMETVEDFVAILKMVKDKYPEKIPLASHIGTYRLTPFRIWMGIDNGNFIEKDDGTVMYFMNHPNYKDFCRFINQLYRDGYIMADNFSLGDAECKALLQNAQCFAFSGFSQGELYRYGIMSKTVEPSAVLAESKPLKSSKYEMGRYYYDSIGWSGVVITKKNKNPEKAIKFMEYLFTDEGQKLAQWGLEGREWVEGSDGYPVFSDEWLEASADEDLLYGKFNPGFYFGTSAAVEATGRIAVVPEDYRAVYDEIKPLLYVCPWLKYAEPKGDIDEKNIMTKLEDLKESGEIQVFLSESDEEFEANFQKYMNDAKKIGIDQLEDYMNKAVPAAKALYN